MTKECIDILLQADSNNIIIHTKYMNLFWLNFLIKEKYIEPYRIANNLIVESRITNKGLEYIRLNYLLNENKSQIYDFSIYNNFMENFFKK